MRARIRGSLVTFLDALVVAGMLSLPILWMIGRFRLEVGDFKLSVRWGLRPFIALAILLVARFCIARIRANPPVAGLLSHRRVQQLLLTLTVVVAMLPLVDLVLASRGYTRNPQPIVITDEHDWVYGQDHFLADSHLLWKFRPGATIHGQRINQLGFPEREINPDKAEGARRVICMGDSCTAEGNPTYSTLLHRRLTNTPPARKTWEAFHNGVHGYSVLQGLALFRITTRQLEPDIVTLYYGRNGHWRAQNSDARRIASRDVTTPWALLSRLIRFDISRRTDNPAGQLRVPPQDYEAALIKLIGDIRAAGAIPILITAPRASRLSRLIAEGQHTPIEELLALHDRYVAITRGVAEKSDCALLDASAAFAKDPRGDALFLRDGIHLRDAGRELLVDLLYEEIAGRDRDAHSQFSPDP